MVFIDADHSYENTKQDIQDWFPKVRVGGILCGHDIDHKEWPGVGKAVREIFGIKFNYLPEGSENGFWWVMKGVTNA